MKGQDIQIKSNAKGKDNDMPKKPKVAIVMGSDSDFPVMEGCLNILKEFDVETSVAICSAHRTPDRAAEIARNAESEGCDLIIGAAGKAAHLPGVLAAYTVLPVIGIPIKSSTLDGLDSLLSIVQMPQGVPVATVAINGSGNAALLAIQILGGTYPDLREKMREYKKKMAEAVEAKNQQLQARLRGAVQ
jgi:5-(carboxyamino)imidazole ribonucleotide mutase